MVRIMRPETPGDHKGEEARITGECDLREFFIPLGSCRITTPPLLFSEWPRLYSDRLYRLRGAERGGSCPERRGKRTVLSAGNNPSGVEMELREGIM
ncbi:hypothetical protein Pmani_026437 [Petrolisthes manimaculis]|uniref:Uncharacterized protein n=1 Tax=Petrolisthes manimaculis TaxID=1843537 RepID=A0AAE1P5Y0_9EUCA|nr:hypothetical protein Pmani_026437 [Petrolisthes manimaculis]